jgi:pimeloyl-ACP methyl ester carboxylesterase
VAASDGWDTYTGDQIGLMDHLGIDKFHVAGMCIGGPYCFGLIAAARQRVVSATLFQTIGRDANRDAFYAMFDDWAGPLQQSMADVPASAWASFRENMYGGEQTFFNVDENFVANCDTPLLVLMGNDLYHPESSSRLVAATAPNVEFIEQWKEGEHRAAAMSAFAEFLSRHTAQS